MAEFQDMPRLARNDQLARRLLRLEWNTPEVQPKETRRRDAAG